MNRDIVFVITGLTYGDEAKGATTDFLARALDIRTVVRFGGPQAGHNVVTEDGLWHCFAQFGSHSLQPAARTYLPAAMLVELENLEAEAAALETKLVRHAMGRIIISADCRLVTPMHKMVGQMQEVARGAGAVGSCGLGVGQTVRDAENGLALTVRDFLTGQAEAKLAELVRVKTAQAEAVLADCPAPEMIAVREYFRERNDVVRLAGRYREIIGRLHVDADGSALEHLLASGPTIFEQAQGVLLDRRGGFWPHVTQTTTTSAPARKLLASLGLDGLSGTLRIGLLRAYGHRHGPGPFVTEDPALAARLADRYNPANRWQGPFRVGWLDLVALRYALSLNGGVDCLALAGLDQLSGLPTVRVCGAYDYEGDLTPLDRHFNWHPLGPGHAAIEAIKLPAADAVPGELAGLLQRCRPGRWHDLPGWSENLAAARRWPDLPKAARAYVRFIENQLGAAVHILSVGPRAHQRMFLH